MWLNHFKCFFYVVVINYSLSPFRISVNAFIHSVLVLTIAHRKKHLYVIINCNLQHNKNHKNNILTKFKWYSLSFPISHTKTHLFVVINCYLQIKYQKNQLLYCICYLIIYLLNTYATNLGVHMHIGHIFDGQGQLF